MKNLLALIILSSFLVVSCTKKDYKPNIQTIVSGQAYDSLNKEPYRGLRILIGEYDEFNYGDNGAGLALVSYRDSAVTDSNGNYSMKFTTSGKGDSYYLSFKKVPANVRFISDKNAFDVLPYNKAKQIQNIGSSVKYDFKVWKQYYMRSRIIFNNNSFPPVTVLAANAQFPLSGFTSAIYGKSNDTVVNIPISKNMGSFTLLFYITDPATQKLLRNPLIALNPIINKDTIDGPAYTIYPATFK
jgi:hypothetical protein